MQPGGALDGAPAFLNPELSALQRRLQHNFANPRLLERALTHRSFTADHNERLEFLGDSVLNLAVSGLLFDKLNQLPEGDLDAQVDVALLLVEHRVGQQAYVIARVAQGQLENRHGFLAPHAPRGQQGGQALIGVRGMTQHILQTAVGKDRRMQLLLCAKRQAWNAHGLPGLSVAFARQVQRREDRQHHTEHADYRNEERQAENEQRAPGQRRTVARRQQQPHRATQHRARQRMADAEHQQLLQLGRRQPQRGPTAAL